MPFECVKVDSVPAPVNEIGWYSVRPEHNRFAVNGGGMRTEVDGAIKFWRLRLFSWMNEYESTTYNDFIECTTRLA